MDHTSSSEKITPYLWLLFIICLLSNVFAGVASTLMSVYLPVVVKDLLGNSSEAQVNNVSAYINAWYFIGWAIGGLIWGVIGDWIGRSKSLALAIGMYGLCTFLKGLAPSWEVLQLFQFFCGFGVGGVLVMNTTLMSEAWPEKTRALFIGFVSIGFPIGIFSSGAIDYFVSSWRQGFFFGLFPMLLALVAWGALRESPEWEQVKEDNDSTTEIADYRTTLFSGSIIFGCMLIGLWAIFSWVPTWVQSLLVSSNGQDERGLSLMLLGAGGLTGGFLSGWVMNLLGARKTMMACFFGCFLFSFLLFKLNTSFTLLTAIEIGCLALVFGVSQGALAVYIPLLFPVPIRGTATGICFNLGRFFTAAAVFYVGAWVVALGGYGQSLFAFSFVFVVGFLFVLFSSATE
jgi:predicted MFS family arabinose efflux permease